MHFRSPGDVAQGVCAFYELFFDGEACVIRVLGFQAADAHAVGPERPSVLNDSNSVLVCSNDLNVCTPYMRYKMQNST
ncbi:hypothetical protein J41TS2_00300 [Bacillus sonorensis]|nr:hypothetical protein J41TS2_00300 [Bacillus sonorensis]